MYEFKLPDLGEGIHEAEIIKWYVQVGKQIEEDGSLVDVETDKAAVTIPSPVGGSLVSVAGQVGDTVQVGEVLAVIDNGDGMAASAGKKNEPKKIAQGSSPQTSGGGTGEDSKAASRRKPGQPVPAAPATRRLARELGVDLNRVPGTGPADRVTDEDVRRFSEGGAPQDGEPVSEDRSARQREDPRGNATGSLAIPLLEVQALPDFSRFGPVTKEDLRSIRRKTARRMTTASLLIPHVAHFDDADVTALEAFRQRNKQRLQEETGVHLTLLAFAVKAATRALRKFPQFNASIDGTREEIIYKNYYNVGVAVATERGLMVPVVRETDRKSVTEIGAAIEDIATRGREGTLTAEDFQAATFTVTNMGPVGGTAATPIINHPEVAILAVMRATDQPVVRDGRIVIRKMMPLILSFDHRIIDGADAAAFVNEIVRLLGDPETLLLES